MRLVLFSIAYSTIGTGCNTVGSNCEARGPDYSSLEPYRGKTTVVVGDSEGLKNLLRQGYDIIGWASFTAGPSERVSEGMIRKQGQKVGVDIVLWQSEFDHSADIPVRTTEYQPGTTSASSTSEIFSSTGTQSQFSANTTTTTEGKWVTKDAAPIRVSS